MSQYVFDQTWERERDRLRSLESIYDQATARYLDDLGVSAGWSCLEVGCGAGGVASWLARRVGPGGRVLATDLDTRFMDEREHHNVEIRTHDIVSGAPETSAFDVAHARAVVEHVADRDAALANIFLALRPGGWVLIEDVDFGGAMAAALARYASPSEHTPLVERMYRAGEAVFGAVGADACYGTRLVAALECAGFEQIGGELHAAIVGGGTEQWSRGTAQQLGEHFVRTGIVSADDVEQFLSVSADASVHYAPPAMASVWGRRPSG
jgi:2-polyprenyl-3-methyl-5-hydroxy-6-metoxy-1,4-benzoquinol methylase